jgi:hypothetical protein
MEVGDGWEGWRCGLAVEVGLGRNLSRRRREYSLKDVCFRRFEVSNLLGTASHHKYCTAEASGEIH